MRRVTAILGGVVGLGVAAAALAWQAADQPAERQPPAGAQDFGARLIQGLKSTEGCLGVDAADFQSGKNTIVAWFENKAAVERWYHSPTHTFMMRAVGSDPTDLTPLKHVKDPKTPVMVMASITFGGEQAMPGPVPFSQISIELYTPLPGGAMVNGRLAPEKFPIKHFRDLTPEGYGDTTVTAPRDR